MTPPTPCRPTPHSGPRAAAAVPRPRAGRSILPAAVVGAALAFLVGAAPARGETVIYTFSGSFLGSLNPDPVPPGVSATPLSSTSFGFGVTTTDGNPPPSGGPASSFGPPGTNYTAFTVTPDPGKALNLLSFSFDEKNLTAGGPARWDVFSSVDGFTSSLGGAELTPNATVFTNHVIPLDGPEFQNLTGPLQIRLSGSGGPPMGIGGIWLLDNIRLDFTLVDAAAVPEPSGAALLGLGAAGLLITGWRRRAKRRRP